MLAQHSVNKVVGQHFRGAMIALFMVFARQVVRRGVLFGLRETGNTDGTLIAPVLAAAAWVNNFAPSWALPNLPTARQPMCGLLPLAT